MEQNLTGMIKYSVEFHLSKFFTEPAELCVVKIALDERYGK